MPNTKKGDWGQISLFGQAGTKWGIVLGIALPLGGFRVRVYVITTPMT